MKKTLALAILFTALFSILLLFCSKDPTSIEEPNGQTNHGYFSILNPGWNDRVNIDSTLEIIFLSSKKISDTQKVKITLYKESLPVTVIASSATNNGAFSYKFQKIGSGTGYQIKISLLQDTTKFDFSCYFSLYSNYSGTISITYPTMGSRLLIESSDTIRWKTTEFPGPRLRLDLFCDTTFVSTIVEAMPSTFNKYPWNRIATSLGSSTKYRIKATSESNESIFDYSSYFTIASLYNGGFIFKAPSAITQMASGYNYTILWDTTGSPGSTVKLQLYMGQTLLSTISSSAPNTGRYVWTSKYGMATDSNYRIKISSTLDAGIFAFSSPFLITGVASDRYEPDNQKISAHTLTMDTIENRTITWDDTDWVSVTADSGTTYLVTCRGQGVFQLSCALFLDTASTAATTYSSSTTGNLAWLWTCTKSGRYLTRIIPEISSNTGIYSFKVSHLNPATLANFTTPAASAQLSAGSTVTVKWTPDSLTFGSTVRLYLYKGSKQLLSLSSTSLPNNGSYEWVIPNGFISGSDYTLHLVKPADDRLFGLGPVFSIVGTTPDAFENDDSRDRASNLSMGVSQEHTISFNDTDWVRFSATTGSRYIILLKCTDTFPATITLFCDSSAQSLLTEKTSAKGTLSTMWTCPASAIYYGCINASLSGLSGNYTTTVLPFDSLTALTFTAPQASSVLVRGTQTAITWMPNPVIFEDSVSVSIYKGDMLNSVLTAKYPSGNPTYIWNISDTLKPGNDYRIKIANALKPSFCGFSPKFVVSDIAPDNFEDDGTYLKASSATLNLPQQHTISYNDTDFVQFTADSGSQYILSAIGANMFRFSGALQSVSSTTPVITFSSNASGQSNTVWACTKSGVYYVKLIASTPGTTGAYVFKVKLFDPETIVSFISPAAGTTWSVDSTCTLQWNPDIDLFGANVALYLYLGSSRLIPIAATTANSGSYAWKIPSGLGSGSNYRIQLVCYGDVSLYGFSQAFILNGMPADAYEVDNSWSQAHVYSLGTTELHNITYNDTDWVKFTAESGARYIVRVNGTAAFRTTLAFYYENNWSGFDPYVSNTSGTITALWQCNKNTTAYVRTNSPGATVSSTGNYSLTITKFDSLNALSITSPKPAASFAAGDTIPIEWTPDTSLLGQNVSISVCKGNITILTKMFQTNNGKAGIPLPKNSTISGNDYRIKITNHLNDQIYGYSQTFSVSGVDAVPDGFESDNTAGAARTISPGIVQQHNLIFNDTDWVVMEVEAGAQYVLMGNQSDGEDINVRLHYGTPSASPELFRFSSDRLCKLITSKISGPCYIEIFSSPSNTYMTYSFKIVRYDETNAMKITNPTTGLVVTSGQATTITWTCNDTIFGSVVTIYLYNGNSVSATYYSNNTGSFSWKADGVLSGSNYRIKIVGNTDTAFNAFSPVFTVVGVNVDAYEPDDAPEHASVLELETIQKRNLILNDTDWIKIPAQSGYKYLFEFTANNSVEIGFRLYDSTNAFRHNSYIFSDYCFNNDTKDYLWTCAVSGAYYLNISPWSSSLNTGDYTVKVTRFDTSKSAEISSPVATATWRAGTVNMITWTPDVDLFSSSVNITLCKGNVFSSVAYNTPNTGSYSWLIPVYVENGTDYRIRIERYDASYVYGDFSPYFSITEGLDADTYEPDNIKSKASQLTFGIAQHHTIVSNDTDCVKFQADSGKTYTILDSTSSSRLQLILMDLSTDSWIKSFEATAGETSTEWLCTKTGTYYIRINVYSSWAGNGTPGVYSIKIVAE